MPTMMITVFVGKYMKSNSCSGLGMERFGINIPGRLVAAVPTL